MKPTKKRTRKTKSKAINQHVTLSDPVSSPSSDFQVRTLVREPITRVIPIVTHIFHFPNGTQASCITNTCIAIIPRNRAIVKVLKTRNILGRKPAFFGSFLCSSMLTDCSICEFHRKNMQTLRNDI